MINSYANAATTFAEKLVSGVVDILMGFLTVFTVLVHPMPVPPLPSNPPVELKAWIDDAGEPHVEPFCPNKLVCR